MSGLKDFKNFKNLVNNEKHGDDIMFLAMETLKKVIPDDIEISDMLFDKIIYGLNRPEYGSKYLRYRYILKLNGYDVYLTLHVDKGTLYKKIPTMFFCLELQNIGYVMYLDYFYFGIRGGIDKKSEKEYKKLIKALQLKEVR